MARQNDRPEPPRDPRLTDRPTGRQPDPADTRAPDTADGAGIDDEAGDTEPDALQKAVRSRPRSEVTDDTGEETEDGLDATEEAVRRAAEGPLPERGRP